MKLLIAALALLSFVATSTLPETVVAQAATGQTQIAPDQTNMGAPKTTKKHVTGKKKSSTKKHKKHKKSKKKSTKKRATSSKSKKKPATNTNPS
jgi:hypothetical protein